MPYLILKNGKPFTYRMFPVNDGIYSSAEADPAYLKNGKWTKPYDADAFTGLINDDIEKYTPDNRGF